MQPRGEIGLFGEGSSGVSKAKSGLAVRSGGDPELPPQAVTLWYADKPVFNARQYSRSETRRFVVSSQPTRDSPTGSIIFTAHLCEPHADG